MRMIICNENLAERPEIWAYAGERVKNTPIRAAFGTLNKQDYLVKVLLGIAGSDDLNKKYSINYTSCVVLVINSKGKSNEIAEFLSLYTICMPVIINNNITACILPANAEKQDYLSASCAHYNR